MSEASKKSIDYQRERINLLTELHRPLEEHWKNDPYLDAKGSDHLYKHHVSRLREIYTSHQLDPTINIKPPDDLINVIPVTQLYGTRGILTPKIYKTFKSREDRWDWRFATRPSERTSQHDHNPTIANHYSERGPHAIHSTRDRSVSPSQSLIQRRNSDLPRRPTSASFDTAGGSLRQMLSDNNGQPQRRRPMSASASTPPVRDGAVVDDYDRHGRDRERNNDDPDMRRKHSQSPKRVGVKKPPTAPNSTTMSMGSDNLDMNDKRYRCTQPGLTREDLTIVGQYRLTRDQEEIYKKFLDMLSNFDEYDQKHILEDVQKDCRQMTMLDAIY